MVRGWPVFKEAAQRIVAVAETPAAGDQLRSTVDEAIGNVRVEISVVEGDPGTRIAAAAQEWQAQLVVVGAAPGKDRTAIVTASVSRTVLLEADCSMLVVPHPPEPGF